MADKTLQILDQSLLYALVAFLVILAVILAYAFFLRAPQAGVNRLRTAFHAVLLAALLAAVIFAGVSFLPLSFFENFASVRTLQEWPLRLTALVYQRTYEGFTLQGEVWNQTKGPLENIQAVVRVWGNDRQVLDTITVPLEPNILPPSQAARFNLTYNKNSPFLFGYDVAFLGSDGKVIPHIKGFDVQ
ncbi:MAG: hypothetical protein ACE15E_02435 [Acidobacteriota bacterium]